MPSGWQLAQEKVPVVEASASLNAIRPSRTSLSVGSFPTGMSAPAEASAPVAFVTVTTLTVLPSVFRT
jgi:hypothetical protein